MKMGGAAPAALNAADEIAVEAFLSGRIGFLDIPAAIESVLDLLSASGWLAPSKCVDDVLALDFEVRKKTIEWVEAHRA